METTARSPSPPRGSASSESPKNAVNADDVEHLFSAYGVASDSYYRPAFAREAAAGRKRWPLLHEVSVLWSRIAG